MMLVSSKTSKEKKRTKKPEKKDKLKKKEEKIKKMKIKQKQTKAKSETRNKKHDFLRANWALKSSQLRKAKSTSSTHQDTTKHFTSIH
jgi:hypothetical protein